jgi:hypothetical protein
MSIKSKLRWIALVGALALGAGLYVLSPWWSLAGLTLAVQRDDRYGMQRYIDFPRVRESITAQVNEYLAEKTQGDDVAGALGAVIGSVVVDRAVETAVSPAGLAKLLAISRETRRDRASGLGKVESRSRTARSLHDRLRLEWVGVSSVRVQSFNRKGKWVMTGYLERQGLTWRLVDIELPGLVTQQGA